jgi:hypothetical protein
VSICPGGNCTWPSYQSRAVCNASYLTTSKPPTNDSTSTKELAYNLPPLKVRNNPSSTLNGDDTVMTLHATAYANETITFQNHSTLILSCTTMKSSSSYLNKASRWEDTKPIATECALYFCVNEYLTSFINGTISEKALASSLNRSPTSLGYDVDPHTIPRLVLGWDRNNLLSRNETLNEMALR